MTRRPGLLVVAASLLVSACTRAPSAANRDARPAPPASLTKFDWKLPCRVPVKEHAVFDKDDDRRVSYVVEVLPWKDGQLQVRLRDFALLELNGEDMSAPERKAQANAVVAQWALVPVLFVASEGGFLGAGPIEVDRIVKELELSSQQAETLRRLGDASPRVEDAAAETWRAWVGAWTPWTLAPGEKQDAKATLHSKQAGDVPVVAHAESRSALAGQVELELSYSLDTAGVARHMRWLIDSMDDMPAQPPGSNPFRAGTEKITYVATTDRHTLRPQHTRYEDELHLDFAESGPSDHRQIREVDWDWAHAEGCGR